MNVVDLAEKQNVDVKFHYLYDSDGALYLQYVKDITGTEYIFRNVDTDDLEGFDIINMDNVYTVHIENGEIQVVNKALPEFTSLQNSPEDSKVFIFNWDHKVISGDVAITQDILEKLYKVK